MGPFLIAIVAFKDKMRAMGGPKRMFHFYRRVFKRNRISVIMGFALIFLLFFLINTIVKMEKIKRMLETQPVSVSEMSPVDCSATDGVLVDVYEEHDPREPTPVDAHEKVIVPNVRRYASERLNELKRDLNDYEN